MKYRIMKNEDEYMNGKYYLQKKFLWWWFDVDEEQVCIDGLTWMETKWFDTIEDAENYINPKDNDKIIKYVQC